MITVRDLRDRAALDHSSLELSQMVSLKQLFINGT